MKMKLFYLNNPIDKKGAAAIEFEAEINNWLEEHPKAFIKRIEQSASGGSFSGSLWLITIWYEEYE